MVRVASPSHVKAEQLRKHGIEWDIAQDTYVAKQLSNNHAPLNRPFTESFIGKSPAI
jgi:hypothetical protein